jgi:hypothetical protein
MTERPKALLELTSDEADQLERWVRRRKYAQALALRSRIVPACATGLTNKEVAARLGVSVPTVGKWRSRFVRLLIPRHEPRGPGEVVKEAGGRARAGPRVVTSHVASEAICRGVT